MNKSRGSKKGLQTLVTMVALVAALASTGCTKNSLMGPETDTTVTSPGDPSQAGREPNYAGREANF
jgi:hypothetical protein